MKTKIEELINRLDSDKSCQCLVCETNLNPFEPTDSLVEIYKNTDFYYIICSVCYNENITKYFIDRMFIKRKDLFFTSLEWNSMCIKNKK